VALICLFQGGYIFCFGQDKLVCATKYYSLLAKTFSAFIHTGSTTHNEYLAYKLLINVSTIMFRSFYIIYIVLCLCYSYDLYLTIKNPLYPAKKRMRWYFIWCIVALVGVFSLESFL